MSYKEKFPKNSLNQNVVPKISVLLSAVHYFLHHVIIIISESYYRLLVIHDNRMLLDKHYKTLYGAKRAFERRFDYMKDEAFKENTWSRQYIPDKKWLQDKLNLTKSAGKVKK